MIPAQMPGCKQKTHGPMEFCAAPLKGSLLPSLGLIGIYSDSSFYVIFLKQIKENTESIENHTKRMSSETSTNCLIQNMFPELFQKVDFFRTIIQSYINHVNLSK